MHTALQNYLTDVPDRTGVVICGLGLRRRKRVLIVDRVLRVWNSTERYSGDRLQEYCQIYGVDHVQQILKFLRVLVRLLQNRRF